MKTVILILIFFSSCKNNDVKKIIKEPIKITLAEPNSKNEPKLFLEYWDTLLSDKNEMLIHFSI